MESCKPPVPDPEALTSGRRVCGLRFRHGKEMVETNHPRALKTDGSRHDREEGVTAAIWKREWG